ncbi:MAG: 2Fe-2S iron-sulfur cluster-binding protein [Burkholderiales bacterium]|nr:2Fe-2S iron-sulfur cluster-binding protein [Burkholderiales bacterium]
MPLLLAYHIAGTRFLWQALGREVDYPRIVWAIWSDPVQTAKQIALITAVWLHLCFGIHFWLRIRPWYPRAQPWLLGAAVLVPALALAGFVSAGANASPPPPQPLSPGEHAFLLDVRDAIWWTFALGLGAVLAVRILRAIRHRSYRIHHPSGRVVAAPVGASILEALRDARIPHASVCGGRARCTTCRVRIGGGAHALAPPAPLEAEALERIGAAPNVPPRLPVAPLGRRAHHAARAAGERTGRGAPSGRRPAATNKRSSRCSSICGARPRSRRRGFPTTSCSSSTQFFAEMSEALAATGGHYAQFTGDGLLALYGLEGDLGPACRAALAGAADMKRRLATLNAHLAPELGAPLRIGIGIHVGTAIVGTMGPPAAPDAHRDRRYRQHRRAAGSSHQGVRRGARRLGRHAALRRRPDRRTAGASHRGARKDDEPRGGRSRRSAGVARGRAGALTARWLARSLGRPGSAAGAVGVHGPAHEHERRKRERRAAGEGGGCA